MKRKLALLLIVCVLFSCIRPAPVNAAQNKGEYTGAVHGLIEEPNNFTAGFYTGNDDASRLDDLSQKWVDGLRGKGLQLNGQGDQVRFDPALMKNLDSMTIDLWVNWQGDATPETPGPDTGFWWQSLLGMSGPNGNLFKLMPANFNNTDYKHDNTILDGLALEITKNDREKFMLYQPVEEGTPSNALALGQWTYIAVTFNGETVTLYRDGKLFAQLPCPYSPKDFGFDLARIGSYWAMDYFNLPLNGIVDEAHLYEQALTGAQVESVYKNYTETPPAKTIFDENGEYKIVNEPGAFRDGFYSNVENFSSVGKVGELSSHWVQGVSGKGLQFNGSGEHVLINPKIKNELKDAMTFESWVKFSGDATPDSTGPDTGFWWQSMFTFSGPGGNWMKAMPAHFNNTEYKNGNTILDGAAVELQQNFDSNGPKTTVFRPVKENSGGNALPENQWCHFAFVLDGKNAGIYVNGEIFAQTPCSLTPEDFHWDTFRIGSYFLQDKFNIPFYGVMDETTLYNKARTAAEIRADYQKNKPADSGKKEQKIFDAQGAYRVIDEPGDFTDSLYSGVKDFNSVGKVAKPVWEEGITGKALKLNGQGQHVLVGEKLQNELDASLSVETWVRFDGDATPESSGPDTGYWWQSLFAFSGAGGNWIKAMPAHYNNTDYKKGNTILDGAAVEIQRDWDNGGPKTTVYKPIESGAKSTALPQGKWSHVAFTMDGSYAKLYVNGVLIGSAPCKVNVSELNLADFRIGNYFTQDKFNLPLYGALDDTTIYNLCRTPAQIKADYERGKARAAQLSGSLFENGAYTIVDEPENFTAGIFAGPEDDSEIKDTASVWVDGIKGKGIELDGLGRHIRFDPKVFQEGNAATVSLCVYWRGDATPDTTGADTGFWWQTLLGLSGPNGNLFRLMPSHFNNTDYLIDGTQLDGMALETLKNDSEKGTVYQPVKTGDSTTSLALEGWSHVAVTVDGEWIRLYLNGRLFAEEEWKYTLDEYNFDLARIGMYYLVDKFNVPLNAIVDECFVYDHAYSAEEIAQLTNRYDGLLTDRPVIDDTPSDFRQGYLESLNYTGEYPIVPQEKAPVPTALIIGLSLGGVAVLGGAGGTAAFLIRRKKKRA